AIGTKWVFRNKKDERGITIRNKARLVTQGHIQEEGIDYDEVFAHVARIEAIRLFLAYTSFKYFMVYQMDVKCVFLYGKIEKEVYVCQPFGFEDPDFPDKVYKVEKALYGLHQAPKARYQVNPKVSPLHAMKKIFRYLKGQPKFGFWYPKDSPFDLVAYTDSDYAGASLDRKSTSGGCQFLSLVRAATTASSLEAEQDSGNINKTQSKTTPNESSSQGTDSGGGPRCQDTMGDTIAQTRVLALEQTKTTQANEIDSLKRRVKKLEKKQRSRTHKLKRLYKVGLTARVESSDDEHSLGEDASKHGMINSHGELVFVAKQDENVIEKDVDAAQVQLSTAATTSTILIDEVTWTQALAELKHTKPKAKAKRIVFHELEESTTTTTTIIPKSKSQDKGKAIMIEEPVKLKKKDQIMLDEEVALKLQAEFDKEQRLAREKAHKEEEANIALIETWMMFKQKLILIINWLKECKQKNNKN
nr:copia protein [Tanacetum cinerariifolium]